MTTLFPSPSAASMSSGGSGAAGQQRHNTMTFRVEGNTTAMEALDIVDLLSRKLIMYTGGQDRNGSPFLTFPAHPPTERFSGQDVRDCILYCMSIINPSSVQRGMTVIIDARQGYWSSQENMKTFLLAAERAAGSRLKAIYIVEPARRTRGSSLRKEKIGVRSEPQLVTCPKLQQMMGPTQLTSDLGGTLRYSHEQWLTARLDAERFIREAHSVLTHLETQLTQVFENLNQQDKDLTPYDLLRQHDKLKDTVLQLPRRMIQRGENVLEGLDALIQAPQPSAGVPSSSNTPAPYPDLWIARDNVRDMIEALEAKLDHVTRMWQDKEREIGGRVRRGELDTAMKAVTDWISGPGEKLLASQTEIGDSYRTAEELRKEHERLELKCTDTYGTYAELRHKVNAALQDDEYASTQQDLLAQRDYMDSVCRSYAARLERRKRLVLTAVKFHRMVEECLRLLNLLQDMVQNSVHVQETVAVKTVVTQLEQLIAQTNEVSMTALQEGQQLKDQLSLPIHDALGRDITPDNRERIASVDRRCQELQRALDRGLEGGRVRLLRLRQMLQLHQAEAEGEQAIDWLLDLCDAAEKVQESMDKDTEMRKKELEGLHDTAQETYNYGNELLKASYILRRSLRLDLEPNRSQVRRFNEAWQRLSHQSGEESLRYGAVVLFDQHTEHIVYQIEQLLMVLQGSSTPDPASLPPDQSTKDQLVLDCSATLREGEQLRERLMSGGTPAERSETELLVNGVPAPQHVSSQLVRLQASLDHLETAWSQRRVNHQITWIKSSFIKQDFHGLYV